MAADPYGKCFSKLTLRILTFIVGMISYASCMATQAAQAKILSQPDIDIKDLTFKAYELSSKDSIEDALELYTIAAYRYQPALTQDEKYYAVIAMNNIGSIYLDGKNNPEAAFPWLSKAERAARDENFKVLLPGIYDNLAHISQYYGDYQQAVELLKKSFSMTLDTNIKTPRQTSDTRFALMLMVFNDMVSLCIEHESLEDIQDEIQQLQTVRLPEMPLARYSVNLCNALTYMLKAKPEEAYGVLERGQDMIDISTDSLRYVVNHHLYSAKAASKTGDRAAALRHLNSAMLKAKEANMGYIETKILLEKSRLLPDSANLLQLQAYQIRDSLYGVQSMAKIKDLEAAETINLMAAQTAAITEKHHRKLLVIYVMTAVLIIIVLLIVLLIIRNRKLAMAYRAIVNSHLSATHEKKLLTGSQIPIDDIEKKSSAIPADESRKKEVAAAVKDIITTNQEIYSPDFSLDRMAEIIDIKPKYLSAIINEMFGRNLSTLLAEARIQEACNMLTDSNVYPQLTLDAIAAKVGYRSRTHFSSVFKKITGMSPSKWALIADEQSRASLDISDIV